MLDLARKAVLVPLAAVLLLAMLLSGTSSLAQRLQNWRQRLHRCGSSPVAACPLAVYAMPVAQPSITWCFTALTSPAGAFPRARPATRAQSVHKAIARGGGGGRCPRRDAPVIQGGDGRCVLAGRTAVRPRGVDTWRSATRTQAPSMHSPACVRRVTCILVLVCLISLLLLLLLLLQAWAWRRRCHRSWRKQAD